MKLKLKKKCREKACWSCWISAPHERCKDWKSHPALCHFHQITNTKTEWIQSPIFSDFLMKRQLSLLLPWNTWWSEGAPRTSRTRGQTWSFLSPRPGAMLPFVPKTAVLLGFPTPIPSSVREYPNYMRSKEWSRHRIHVNACTCMCLLIGILNWVMGWMSVCCSWLDLNGAPALL